MISGDAIQAPVPEAVNDAFQAELGRASGTFAPTTFAVGIDATLTVIPFAFGTPSISDAKPELHTVGVRIGNENLMGFADSPHGEVSAAFVAIADACAIIPTNKENIRNACINYYHALQLPQAIAAIALPNTSKKANSRKISISSRIPSDPFSREKCTTFLSSLGVHDALIYAAVIGTWTQAYVRGYLDLDGDARLNASALLDMMGRKKHKNGGHKTEQKKWVIETILKLAETYANGKYQLPNGEMAEIKGPLIKVDFGTGVGIDSYDFFVQPGKSAKQYLTKTTQQTAVFFDRIAKLDIRNAVNRIALQIALYLAPQYRIREIHNNFQQPFRIETILRGAGIELQSNSRHALRFRTEIEDAIDLVETCGGTDFWDYLPEDIEALPELRWFPAWLECRATFEPPPEILDEGHFRSAAMERRKENARRRFVRREMRKNRLLAKASV